MSIVCVNRPISRFTSLLPPRMARGTNSHRSVLALRPIHLAIWAMAMGSFTAHAADTGDAPASYGTASHEVVAGAPYLGAVPPDDNAPVSGPFADGDDADMGEAGGPGDDEDGVFAFPELVQNGKAYTTNVFVSNPTANDATLVGWIDFDGDGVFAADEAAVDVAPAGAANIKVKLLWNALSGVTTNFFGPSFVRIRVTSEPMTPADATATFNDGEVEDYSLEILADVDGDEIPDRDDTDNDNDGIPDLVEGDTTDTDADGVLDRLDVDSDSDGIADFVEAGADASQPVDTDSDGQPDYQDLDSNNDGTPDSAINADDSDGDGILDALEGTGDADGDGVLNINDIDSDNDLIPDSVEGLDGNAELLDSDGDRVPDYLDLDSDNDGITDIREAQRAVIPVDIIDAVADGRADGGQVFGTNGFVDSVETLPDSGVPVYAVADTDGDGLRDYIDLDSDADGAFDIVEAGGSDTDSDGVVDEWLDADGDGINDAIDIDFSDGADGDADNIIDTADVDAVGGDDQDADGIVDGADSDANGDGFQDGIANTLTATGLLPDADGDAIPDFQDSAIVGDGTLTTDPDAEGPQTPNPPSLPGEPSSPTTPPSDGVPAGDGVSGGRVETGLSGVAGCSVQLANGHVDFALLLPLLIGAIAVWRRRQPV